MADQDNPGQPGQIIFFSPGPLGLEMAVISYTRARLELGESGGLIRGLSLILRAGAAQENVEGRLLTPGNEPLQELTIGQAAGRLRVQDRVQMPEDRLPVGHRECP